MNLLDLVLKDDLFIIGIHFFVGPRLSKWWRFWIFNIGCSLFSIIQNFYFSPLSLTAPTTPYWKIWSGTTFSNRSPRLQMNNSRICKPMKISLFNHMENTDLAWRKEQLVSNFKNSIHVSGFPVACMRNRFGFICASKDLICHAVWRCLIRHPCLISSLASLLQQCGRCQKMKYVFENEFLVPFLYKVWVPIHSYSSIS